MRGSAGLALALLLSGTTARAQESGGRVALRWQAIQGATGYDLQIARDAAFVQLELELRVELAGHRLPAPRDGRRYWRVRAVDVDGRPGAWSSSKVIEPLTSPGEPPTAPAEPDRPLLEVPPLPPAKLPLPGAVEPAASREGAPPEVPLAALADEPSPFALLPSGALAGLTAGGLLREARPGILMGWRSNLLGIDAPQVAAEGSCALPWFGASWRAALRAGWWRDRAVVPTGGGLATPLRATADVFPLTAILMRRLSTDWAQLYAGAGGGVHLVVIRLPGQGSLDVSGALEAVAGAGRTLGPGELFGELSAGLGGVAGPLGSLRTGGVSLSVGYRLELAPR